MILIELRHMGMGSRRLVRWRCHHCLMSCQMSANPERFLRMFSLCAGEQGESEMHTQRKRRKEERKVPKSYRSCRRRGASRSRALGSGDIFERLADIMRFRRVCLASPIMLVFLSSRMCALGICE
jgi:hypothetical protein